MTLPFELEFAEGASLGGSFYGKALSLERAGRTLSLAYGEDEWTVGMPEGTTKLRLGASLGPLPFLVLPKPVLIVPGGESLQQELLLPLHLDLAAVAKRAVLLKELKPGAPTRSLYGPVDFGWVCWTVRAMDPATTRLALAGKNLRFCGRVAFTIENHTATPHEVSRIMIPVDLIGLYSDPAGELQVSDVTMTLVSDHSAELTIEAPPKAKAINNVLDAPIRPARRSFSLSHSYRNKTGLEYGF